MATTQFVSRMLFAAAVTACVSAPVVAQPAGTGEPIVVTGFQTPESVVHDRDMDWYVVSNVGLGNPAALDHNGFISKVTPGGVVLDLAWIQDGVSGATLNGPKGLALHDDALFVADIDTLRIFDRRTGAPLRSVPMPNPFAPKPLFLNDVVVGGDGTAYLTDTRNNAIFEVDRKNHATVIASGPQLGGPNGIRLDRGSVSWVTFFGHEVKRLTRDGQILTEAMLPVEDVSSLGLPPGALFLDGYARHEGDLIVSSWVTGKVFRIGRSGTDLETIAQFVSALDNPANPDGPADLAIDSDRHRLLIPLFNRNELVIQALRD